jgi:hypothetical protein
VSLGVGQARTVTGVVAIEQYGPNAVSWALTRALHGVVATTLKEQTSRR